MSEVSVSDTATSAWAVRPDPAEYNAFYSGYVAAVPDGELIPFLTHQLHRLQHLVATAGEQVADVTYADDKWTVRQVLGHIVDTEWIFGSRLLRIARGDPAALPGMDQETYMAHANVEDRSLASLMAELSGLRTAVTILMDSLRPEVLASKGSASGYSITVRAQGWILAGHCEHHLAILKERYELSEHD